MARRNIYGKDVLSHCEETIEKGSSGSSEKSVSWL
jgi:hypothetical protein